MEIPGAVISTSASIGRSLVWNLHMSWAATDVSDWLLQLAPALCIAADDQFSTFHLSVMADIVITHFNFLDGTIHGNITKNINNAVPGAKRRRIIIDSESEE